MLAVTANINNREGNMTNFMRALLGVVLLVFQLLGAQPALAQDPTITDNDGDTFPASVDCNDNDPAVNPRATEVCNGVDDDCNAATTEVNLDADWRVDHDGDGFGGKLSATASTCDYNQPPGWWQAPNTDWVCFWVGSCELDHERPAFRRDCADFAAHRYPFASETGAPANEDWNCDGSTRNQDRDGDGFTGGTGDCNDNQNQMGDAFRPGAPEVCDRLDNDCDGVVDEATEYEWCVDADGDGYGDQNTAYTDCQHEPDHVSCDSNDDGVVGPEDHDCDDSAFGTKPNTVDKCFDDVGNPDTVDDDCDGVVNQGC